MPRFKVHLLPRILDRLRTELNAEIPPPTNSKQAAAAHIIIRHDRLYMHQIVKFNYTTYDMRRDQDAINPRTTHCNVMLLAQLNPSLLSDEHPFIYGHVLGIFHVNVFYNGPGAVDYVPRRFDCLWVRWYDRKAEKIYEGTRGGANPRSRAEEKPKSLSHRLDRLSFRSWEAEDAVGFIDPSDVLRGCHIIPAFSSGLSFPNGEGSSSLAHDSEDWNAYYISR